MRVFFGLEEKESVLLRWWQRNFEGTKQDPSKFNVVRIENPEVARKVATRNDQFDEVSEKEYEQYQEAQKQRNKKEGEE